MSGLAIIGLVYLMGSNFAWGVLAATYKMAKEIGRPIPGRTFLLYLVWYVLLWPICLPVYFGSDLIKQVDS